MTRTASIANNAQTTKAMAGKQVPSPHTTRRLCGEEHQVRGDQLPVVASEHPPERWRAGDEPQSAGEAVRGEEGRDHVHCGERNRRCDRFRQIRRGQQPGPYRGSGPGPPDAHEIGRHQRGQPRATCRARSVNRTPSLKNSATSTGTAIFQQELAENPQKIFGILRHSLKKSNPPGGFPLPALDESLFGVTPLPR